MALISLALVAAGCSAKFTGQAPRGLGPSEIHQFSEWMMQITNKLSAPEKWTNSLRALRAKPVVETSLVWTKVILDPDYSLERRQACLNYLVFRHMKPGTLIGNGLDPELRKWVDSEHVSGTYSLSAIPIEIRPRQPVFAFAIQRHNGRLEAAYVRVNKELSTGTFIAILRGEMRNFNGFRVTEVWTEDGAL